MKIAIFGATSEIAKDLIVSLSHRGSDQVILFARKVKAVNEWLAKKNLENRFKVKNFSEFDYEEYFDALINFVGVGNPAEAKVMGASILELTLQYDTMILEYLERHPLCRYIFLSSGAVYGASFKNPANDDVPSLININDLQHQDWYAIAKLYAECRHRALPKFAIVDIRVFNYFSHTQNMNSSFFIADAVRAICENKILETSANHMVRDYLNPSDFCQLVHKILNSSPTNTCVDCYSLEPVDKSTLLMALQEKFGLRYEVANSYDDAINRGGNKSLYYSLSRRAKQFGYEPKFNAINGVLNEIQVYLTLNIIRN